MVTPEMLALLESLGAAERGRSGRSLLDHLEGTRAVLARWGSSTEICLAGLFHSVYGAEGGRARDRDGNLGRRDEVRALIGAPAEELAYLYAACERRGLFTNRPGAATLTVYDLFQKRDVPVSETTLRALLEIEAANFVEGPLERITFPDALLAQIRIAWDSGYPFVTPQAHAEVRGRFRALDERGAA